MTLFDHNKFNRTLRLSILLFVAAGGGIFSAIRAFVQVSTARPTFEDMHMAALSSLILLTITTVTAFGALILAALALYRRETIRRKKSEMSLARCRRTTDESSDLIAIMRPSGRIEYVNAAVERITGFGKSDLIGKRHSPPLPWYEDAGTFRGIRDSVLEGKDIARTINARTKGGASLTLQERIAPLRNDAGAVTWLISTARDLTRERHLEDRIDYLDQYDPLTALPNRRNLIDLLEKALSSAKGNGASVSVLVLDIDRFNHLNDLFGAGAGDDILKRLSARIRSSVSPSDIVARTGNDEFAVVHVDEQKPVLAGSIAQQLRTAISQDMTAAGQDFVITVSTGAAVHPDDGEDAWTLLKNADLALSRAKAQGRNGIQFFNREITALVKEFFILEKNLFAALRKNEYLLHYQPYCDLRTRKVSGAEALIRWNNPDLGVVSPAKFIPSLEDTGMVIEVGRWILETACSQIKEWEKMNRHFPVSVNLSLVQFRHQHLVGMVRDAINNFRLDPRRLTLEVTETVFMHDLDFAVNILKRLKDEGVTLSVDDFGTGYSSLSYIKKLPVDNLKIDISFVRDVTRDQDAASIITAITTLARSLNLKTIAEGVETEEQRNILHLLRCDMGQGYLFSRAVSAEEFGKLPL